MRVFNVSAMCPYSLVLRVVFVDFIGFSDGFSHIFTL
nr:MAG TPA: hypothetical protein [Caudoviricetes sp.]